MTRSAPRGSCVYKKTTLMAGFRKPRAGDGCASWKRPDSSQAQIVLNRGRREPTRVLVKSLDRFATGPPTPLRD